MKQTLPFYHTLLFLLLANFLVAQISDHDCATEFSSEKSLSFNFEANKSQFVNVTLPIQFHIVADNLGNHQISINNISDELEIVNERFVESGLQFVQCSEIEIINSSLLHEMDYPTERLLVQSFLVPNSINVFIFDNIQNGMNSPGGYAFLPNHAGLPLLEDHYIGIRRSTYSNGSTLAHELGHYFGLYHTHEDNFGIELVNGSNCMSAGDLLCDTPADPKLSTCQNSFSCTYVGDDGEVCPQFDVNGDEYNPDTSNIMSYSNSQCKDSFSPSQSFAMNQIYQVHRSYLNCSIPFNNDCSSAMSIASDPQCIPTLSSLEGSTESGLSIPTCGDFTSATAFDVFFEFQAINEVHIVILDALETNANESFPDLVFALYDGCSNSDFIFCQDDLGGGGGIMTVELTGLTPGSLYYIRVFDYGSIQPENEEFTICLTHDESSEIPDVQMTDVFTDPLIPVVGEAVDLHCEFITNIYVEDVEIEYFIDGVLIDDDTEQTLEPGEIGSEYENNYVFASEGTYQFCARIVSPNSNTSNDELCMQIIVSPFLEPDLIVENLTVSPLQFNQGEVSSLDVEMDICLLNATSTTANTPNPNYRLYIIDECGDQLGAHQTSGSTNNGTNNVCISVSPSPQANLLQVGTYHVYIEIDTNDEISEGPGENNNQICSQEFEVLAPLMPGCTDSNACNYNSNATSEDGSCVFANGCDECLNGTVVDNPEIGSSCDDGNATTENDVLISCDVCEGTPIQVFGCTTVEACNYNPLATDDDGSCVFQELYYTCEGICINDQDGDTVCDELEVLGCQDQTACNYNPLATDPATCLTLDECNICGGTSTAGCSDPNATNYDSTADCDDGSCLYGPCHPDLNALLALYNSADGPNWINNSGWVEGAAGDDCLPCNWHGVTCNAEGRVTELDLITNQLSGSIPIELGDLSNLTQLHLNSNQLLGFIPVELGSMNNLTELNLSSNQLTGIIPQELGNLSNLTQLHLNFNELTGPIPIELTTLSNLTHLYLNNNHLTGSVLPEIGNLTHLKFLYLTRNNLTGTIPEELGELTDLIALRLNFNFLTGPIPPILGGLSNLNSLFLFSNQLSGPIPEELGNLSNVLFLYLNDNQLSGHIPIELGALSNIGYLRLHNNLLSGPIPEELGNLSSLYQLSMQSNQLSDCIPSTFANYCANVDVNLSNNPQLVNDDFSTFCENGQGECIPPPCHPDIDALLTLYNNTGGSNWTNNSGWSDGASENDCLPCEWYGIVCNEEGRVTQLNLYNNQLLGSIPSELNNLNTLTALRLNDNSLSGDIPPEIGDLQQLTSLQLSNNMLTGEIPIELGNLSQLAVLQLFNNSLSGNIPTELGNLNQMFTMDLSNNELIGTIPPEFGNFSGLYNLVLNNNNLSGIIPNELGNYYWLELMRLDNNQLSGCIPLTFSNYCLGIAGSGPGINLSSNPLLDNELYLNFCSTGNGVCSNTCPTDFDFNGITNGDDFAIFLGNFGLTCNDPFCLTDLNLDGITTGEDFAIFLGNYGLTCNTASNTVTDFDGNVYETVSIGNQVWMKDNLKTTHYNNGDLIPSDLTGDELNTTTAGASVNFDVSTYGLLYNWYTLDDSRGICPEGFHPPSYDEWNLLRATVENNGGELKSTSSLWNPPNHGATNNTGFSALPGGQYRFFTNDFYDQNVQAIFWTATETSGNGAAHFALQSYDSNFTSNQSQVKTALRSCRCMQD